MGSLSTESFEQFLDSLKKPVSRFPTKWNCANAWQRPQRWRYAFQTLAANGKVIGICFEDHSAGRNEAEISRTFNEFRFPEKTRAVFSANLKH